MGKAAEKKNGTYSKPKNTGKTAGGNSFSDYNFIRYSPTVQDKAAVKTFIASGVDPMSALMDILENGYKLSLSFDAKNDCFIASLTCNATADTNFKSILTGRGADPTTAIYWLAYLHFHRFDGVWVEDTMGGWDLD